MPHQHHHGVRTTLTLDEDVARKLTEEARRTGKSFKETVNELLRHALNAKKGGRRLERFVVKARPMGARPGINLDDISGLLDELEGPSHR